MRTFVILLFALIFTLGIMGAYAYRDLNERQVKLENDFRQFRNRFSPEHSDFVLDPSFKRDA